MCVPFPEHPGFAAGNDLQTPGVFEGKEDGAIEEARTMDDLRSAGIAFSRAGVAASLSPGLRSIGSNFQEGPGEAEKGPL